MTLSLSIVIPVYNEAEEVALGLAALQPLRALGAEVIVVDGGSQDETVGIATPLADQLIVSERGRARQMNAGAALASRHWLLFLHIDTRLPSNMSEVVMAWDFSHASWGFFSVRIMADGMAYRVIEWLMNRRSYYTGIGTGDQCQFVAREVFKTIGGFADIPLMEDIEISKRLKRVARPLFVITKVETSARKWRREGLTRTVLLMWRLRIGYFLGVSPQRLAAKYYSRS